MLVLDYIVLACMNKNDNLNFSMFELSVRFELECMNTNDNLNFINNDNVCILE
jgi:hypothetical protein